MSEGDDRGGSRGEDEALGRDIATEVREHLTPVKTQQLDTTQRHNPPPVIDFSQRVTRLLLIPHTPPPHIRPLAHILHLPFPLPRIPTPTHNPLPHKIERTFTNRNPRPEVILLGRDLPSVIIKEQAGSGGGGEASFGGERDARVEGSV